MTRARHRRLWTCVAAVALAGCAGRAAPPTPSLATPAASPVVGTAPAALLARLQVDELRARCQVPGVSVAVVQDFRIAWAQAWGVAAQRTGQPATPHTRFQAASISKPVTAMAALVQAADLRWDVDGDINALLAGWKVAAPPGTTVSLHALLDHTSGADDGYGFPGYAPGAALPDEIAVLEGRPPSALAAVRFGQPPGTRERYSGGAYTVVQRLLREQGGGDFAGLVAQRVLTPLHMRASTFQQPPGAELQAVAAHAHDARGRPRADPWRVYPELAAAGLWTTPTDLAQWLLEVQQALRGQGRVLDAPSARRMVTPRPPSRFGAGLVGATDAFPYFSHWGSNAGFKAYLIGHRSDGHGLVVMTNGDNGEALIEELHTRLAAAYGWAAPHPQHGWFLARCAGAGAAPA